MPEELAELIADHGLLKALPPASIELITGCARNVAFDADDMLLEEGAPATTFYLIRRGHVALEVHQPGRQALVIETIGPGNAIGWSWLFPPYRWHFDARALEAVGAIAIDGACLRNKADADPAFGYGLIKCFAAIMLERLQTTRLRLLDIYGNVDAH
jgi:CRP/FNR family transcriptional regulator, cyclic AMP receptor protein